MRMDFNLTLDMQNRHVDFWQAWGEHSGDITSKFAMHDEENDNNDWEDNGNYKINNNILTFPLSPTAICVTTH